MANTLKVPGAELYHEVRGSGPVLLMIPGGPMDAGGFAALADEISDRYTVVTYDCRGNSRSTLDDPDQPLGADVHADDAHRLIEALSEGPAFVLGSSGGATYGLDLAVRYPGDVSVLVAHEPPVFELLPDAASYRSLIAEVGEVYGSAGVFPALQRFAEGMGFGVQAPDDQGEPSPEAAEAMARTGGNLDLFVKTLIPRVGAYRPDVDALRRSRTRIVVGVGEESGDQGPARASRALAEHLGIEPILFPGDHGGFGAQPVAFAKVLDGMLRD